MASDAREAPGGYAQPQITLGERALLSNEEGVRAALPYMSPVAQGLEQQAMFVRDERALKLDLMRKKLLSEEQQATANVQMLQRRCAHYSEIAAAKMREAVARERSEQMRQLDLALSAQRRTLPVRVKGVGTVTPRFGVDLSGDTADGLYGEIVPQSAMVGARSGGGGPRQPAPGEMEGDAITLIWQKRDRKGNEVGPGQPTRNVLGPPLYRRVASNPVDAGFDSTESVNEYKAWYRQYNEALPSAKQGEPSALEQVRAAQEAMVRLLQSAQAKYGSDVDTTRGVFGYGEQDRAAKAVKDTEKLKEAEDQVIRAVKQQTKVIGSTMAELSKVGRAADVDPNEVARAMKSVANQMGNRVMVGQVPMMPQIYAMALEGQSPPSTVQQNATMREAYDKVTTAAATVRQKLREKAEFARAKKLQGLALQLQAAGVDDPVGTLERMGANLPAGFDMPPVAPAQAAAGAPVSTTGTRVAPVPTVQASSPDDLWNKIEMMRMNPNDKQALYEREAAARGWE